MINIIYTCVTPTIVLFIRPHGTLIQTVKVNKLAAFITKKNINKYFLLHLFMIGPKIIEPILLNYT